MAKAAAPSTEVAVHNPAVVALTDQVPDWIKNSSRGSENVTADDMVIPRLEIVQMLSPIKEDHPEAEGMLYNSVTGEVYGTSVLFVPVVFVKQWLLWKDRKAGGGFRGAFNSISEAQERINELVEEGENARQYAITETPSHFGLIVGQDGRLSEIVISMPRSKMKVSRKFNASVNLAGGDRFSRVYEFMVISERNAAGQEYYNLSYKTAGFVSQNVYAAAEKCYEKVSKGFTIAHDSVGDDEGSAPQNSEI